MCGKKSFYDKSFVIFWNFLGLMELGPKNQFLGTRLKMLISFVSGRAQV